MKNVNKGQQSADTDRDPIELCREIAAEALQMFDEWKAQRADNSIKFRREIEAKLLQAIEEWEAQHSALLAAEQRVDLPQI